MIDPQTGRSYPYNPKRVWAVTQETFPEYHTKGKIVFPGDYDFLRIKIPAYRVFESEDQAKARQKHGTSESLKALSTQLPKEVGMSENGNKDLEALFPARYFSFPKPVGLLAHLIGASTSRSDIILDFFAGSGTTAEAVMRLNAEDGGNRRFILVQIPQPIDAKKQKEAHQFVTATLGKPEATIFEITAERIRRAGTKILTELQADKPEAALDTGFRVFDLVNDPDALILQKPLQEATQDDLAAFQQHITTPQPAQLPRILYNLLLAEGMTLSTRIEAVREGVLYRAQNTLFIVADADTDDIQPLLNAPKNPVTHLNIYAPWVQDNNFLLGLKTLLESLNLSQDRLRLRG